MSNPPAAQQHTASLEWPPAVQAALAAALAYVLPKGKPVIKFCGTPGQLDLSTDGGSIRRLLEQRGVTFLSSDLPIADLIDGAQKDEPFSLPFASGSLGGAYAITYLNLDWTLLFPEIMRVVMPNAIFAVGTGDEIATDINNHMEVGWETILGRNKVEMKAEAGSREQFAAALKQSSPATPPAEVIAVCRWSEHFTPRSRLEATKARRGANNRHIAEAVFSRCLKDYERWLKAQYGDLNAPLDLVRECAVHVWRLSH